MSPSTASNEGAPASKKHSEMIAKLKPSAKYLARAAAAAPKQGLFDRGEGKASAKKLIVMDLNNTLVCRKSRTSKAAKTPAFRPYLSTFLQYLFHPESQYKVMIWSSSQPKNVDAMLRAVRLLPPNDETPDESADLSSASLDNSSASVDISSILESLKIAEPKESNEASPSPPLLAVWARDKLNLSAEDYGRKVETVKNLNQIWKASREFDQGNTLLLDDSAAKAKLQPYNHLPCPTFDPFADKNQAVVDCYLLKAIGALDTLAEEEDVSQAIHSGLLNDLVASESNSWMKRAMQACESRGIAVNAQMQVEWASKVLA